MAAAETALLSEWGEGTTAGTPNNNLDLSEKHLVWFSNQTIPEWYDRLNQQGEGLVGIDTAKYTTKVYDKGGYIAYGTSLFSSLIGPELEEDFPYMNAAGELAPSQGNHADDPSFNTPS